MLFFLFSSDLIHIPHYTPSLLSIARLYDIHLDYSSLSLWLLYFYYYLTTMDRFLHLPSSMKTLVSHMLIHWALAYNTHM